MVGLGGVQTPCPRALSVTGLPCLWAVCSFCEQGALLNLRLPHLPAILGCVRPCCVLFWFAPPPLCLGGVRADRTSTLCEGVYRSAPQVANLGGHPVQPPFKIPESIIY